MNFSTTTFGTPTLGYNNLGWSDIGKLSETVTKYKQLGNNIVYLGDQNTKGPYSVLGVQTEQKIPSRQHTGMFVKVEEMRFFTVNDKVNPQVQLAINRIFAPYISMARVLRLNNGKKSIVVSTDVYHKKGRSMVRHMPKTPKRIIDLFRIIYQFIASDGDRSSLKNYADGVIFDFDYIGNLDRGFINLGDDKIDFEFRLLTDDEREEIAKILYFFREYIITICGELLESGTEEYQIQKSMFDSLFNRKISGKSLDEMLNLMITRAHLLSSSVLLDGFRSNTCLDKKTLIEERENAHKIDAILAMNYS